MSGGSWNYTYETISDLAYKLGREKHPLRKAFGKHLQKCATAMKAIEWSDSGDTGEDEWIAPVHEALGRTAPKQEMAVVIEQIREIRDELTNLLERQADETTYY